MKAIFFLWCAACAASSCTSAMRTTVSSLEEAAKLESDRESWSPRMRSRFFIRMGFALRMRNALPALPDQAATKAEEGRISEARADKGSHDIAQATSLGVRRRHFRRKQGHESTGADCAPKHGQCQVFTRDFHNGAHG